MEFSANPSDTRSASLTEDKTDPESKNGLLLDIDEPRQVSSESFDYSNFRKSNDQ